MKKISVLLSVPLILMLMVAIKENILFRGESSYSRGLLVFLPKIKTKSKKNKTLGKQQQI